MKAFLISYCLLSPMQESLISTPLGVDEMERRYGLMKDAGVRDIRGFNRKVEKTAAENEASLLRAQAEAIERAS